MQIGYWIIGMVGVAISILAFFIGQAKAVKSKGYEQGVKDATIENALNTLTNEVKEVSRKIEDINIGELRQRIKALEKQVFKGAEL